MDVRYYIDWDGDGYGGYDDITEFVKDAQWSIGMHEPNQLSGDETILEIILNNFDSRFSPEYNSSPYYGKLVPNKRVYVVAEHLGVSYPMYLGFFDNLDVAPFIPKHAVLRCVGAKQYIQEQLVRLPLLENVRSDEIIEAILEQLALPPSLNDIWILGAEGFSELGETTYLGDLSLASELDEGNTTFAFVADNWDANFRGNQYVNNDWSTGFRGYEAIVDVLRAERGRFFFNRQGKAIFWARDRLQLNTSVVSSYVGSDFVDGKYSFGKDVFNDIRVMVYPRSIDDTPSEVWRLDERIRVGRFIDEVVNGRWAEQESGNTLSVIDPSVTSFTATGSVSYYVEYLAKGPKITFSNNDNIFRFVEEMVISGRQMKTHNKLERQAIDGLSNSQYGRKELRIDSKLMQDAGFAQNVADYELSRLKDPRGVFHHVEMLVDSPAKELAVLSRQIGDRIRLSDDSLGHDKEYFVMGEKHQRSLKNGYRVTWYLEEADMNHFWVLGTEGFSELGETTWLGL